MPQSVVFSETHLATPPVTADVDVLKVIGFLLLQHGKSAEAVTLFDALRVLAPADHKIALSLALAWLRFGDPQAAYAVLESIQIEPKDAAAPTSLLRDPCFYWLQSQALSGLGRTSEAARSTRLFIRLRREFDRQVTT